MKIKWFGHASFLIKTQGKNIYIDPFVLPKNSELADLILVTHDHYDHCDKTKVREIRVEKTEIVTMYQAAAKLGNSPRIVKPWDLVDVGFAKVRAVPSYNLHKPYHPKETGLGFVIEAEGKKIYHAGDTDFIPEMESLTGINVALLPIGGTYTMDTNEAVRAALVIKPGIAIPMHYNYLEGLKANAAEFKQRVEQESKGAIKVVVLEGRDLEI